MWQELYRELGPRGLQIVTVALDTAGVEAVRPWIEAAQPEHPSLIDRAHVVDELFGVTNVPSGVWIDEAGTIVRPPETAYPRRPDYQDRAIPPNASVAEAAGAWGSLLPAVWSFMLALRERGMGSAWTTIHLMNEGEREVADLLGIPFDRVSQGGLFPIAYTIGTDFKPAKREPLEKVLHWDRW